MSMKLLTELEVATILGCPRSRIKRLRMSGALPYLRGRPTLIDEADMLAFVEKQKQQEREKAAAALAPKPVEDARTWAMKAVLLQRIPSRKR